MCCTVGSCCCISDLRLATLVIAVLNLLGNAGMLAFTSWCVKEARLALVFLLDNAGSEENAMYLVRGLRAILAILAVILLVCIAAIVLDIVLFFGAFRRHRDMVQYWTHGHAVVSGAYLVYFWTVVVAHFADGHIGYGILFLVLTMLGGVLTVYFWVVVRSFDLTLQRTNLSTMSGDCGPSSTNSYVAVPTRPGASWETNKPLPPPPYSDRA